MPQRKVGAYTRYLQGERPPKRRREVSAVFLVRVPVAGAMRPPIQDIDQIVLHRGNRNVPRGPWLCRVPLP